jgi:hypothetical protein
MLGVKYILRRFVPARGNEGALERGLDREQKLEKRTGFQLYRKQKLEKRTSFQLESAAVKKICRLTANLQLKQERPIFKISVLCLKLSQVYSRSASIDLFQVTKIQ